MDGHCGKLVTVIGHSLSYWPYDEREARRRAGLSAAAETCYLCYRLSDYRISALLSQPWKLIASCFFKIQLQSKSLKNGSICFTLQFTQDAIADGRLRPRTATWRTGGNIRVVFDSGLFLHYMETWRHPQNRKYVMYRIAFRTGSSHDHMCHVHKTWWNSDVRVLKHASRQTDKQREDRQTYRLADHNNWHPYRGQSITKPLPLLQVSGGNVLSRVC